MTSPLSPPCLAKGHLRDFLLLNEGLNEDELEHLKECPTCQRVLDGLTESEFLDSYRSQRSDSIAAMAFLDPPIQPGDLGSIDSYAIEKEIDHGGMGVVFRGRDENLGRPVAVKVLLNQHGSQSYARFEAEARSVAKLSHANIVSVYGVGRTNDNRPYMVMPLIEGVTLRQLLKSAPMNPRTASSYIMQIASGLEAAHGAGLIHRDIKPANILIDAADGKAKIIDFGLVRDRTVPGLTQADVICGTPEYMSIEQAAHDEPLDPRSDIYSLGIALYECLTGTPPFRGQPLEILQQHRSVEPVSPTQLNRAVPKDLETICLKAIAKERTRRYATAADFSQDLNCFLAGRPIQARPFSHVEKTWSWCKRNRPLSISMFLFVFSLVAGMIGSTAMWIRSQQNAASARQNASDLQQSRERMRDSVQKFQSRIFSNESLHWQMSSDFRRDMFRDVIDYLDEFATFPVDSSATLDSSEDGLANSYLEVANAAFEVGQFEQAALAARRANSRVQMISQSRTSTGLFLQKCNACLIISLAWNRLENATEQDAEQYVESCLTAATQACDLKPDDRLVEASRWSAQLALWEAGYARDRESAQYRKRIESVRVRLNELMTPVRLDEIGIMNYRSMIKAAWLLIPLCADHEREAVFADADENIRNLRESLRTAQKPLLESDRLNGRNAFLKGSWYWTNEQTKAALDSLTQAVTSYTEAVTRQPQNRIWRMELAIIQTQLADYHTACDDTKSARDATNAAILNYVHILETDPKDMALRVSIIESLIRFGELSLVMGEYQHAYRGFFTAAQDCLLLTGQREWVDWGFTTRVWALVHALQALDRPSTLTELANLENMIQYWLKTVGSEDSQNDFDWAKQMLDSRTLPDRREVPQSISKLQRRYTSP
jgi:serine/threonine protein kinase